LNPGCIDLYNAYVNAGALKWWGNTAGASLHEQLKSSKENVSRSGVRHNRSVEQSTDPIEPHIDRQLISKKDSKEKGGYFANNSGCM
jgi:hypothetical protein